MLYLHSSIMRCDDANFRWKFSLCDISSRKLGQFCSLVSALSRKQNPSKKRVAFGSDIAINNGEKAWQVTPSYHEAYLSPYFSFLVHLKLEEVTVLHICNAYSEWEFYVFCYIAPLSCFLITWFLWSA